MASEGPKFHPFMNEMTINIEKEFVRDGVTYIRGTDRNGNNFVAPKKWLHKDFKKYTPEPANGEAVQVKWKDGSPMGEDWVFAQRRDTSPGAYGDYRWFIASLASRAFSWAELQQDYIIRKFAVVQYSAKL